MAVDQDSVIPYYYQIKEEIMSKIRNGELKVGEKLPSEPELAQKFGVSRPTVRQALNELVFSGILWRKRGKGTFVAPPRIQSNLMVYTPFAEEVETQGFIPGIKVLSKKIVKATEEVAKILNIQVDDKVIELIGLRLANKELLALRTSCFPFKLMPQLMEEDLNGIPVYRVIERYGFRIAKARQTFQVVRARAQEARLLKVEKGFPLVLWEGVIYSDEGTPLELTRALYRSDRYQFHVEQHREYPSLNATLLGSHNAVRLS